MKRTSQRIIFVIFQIIGNICLGQSPSKYFIIGNTLQDKYEFNSSIIQYSKAISKDPNNPEYYCRRAKSFRKVGKYDEALKDIDICLGIDSNYKEGHYEKGSIYAVNYNYELALQEYSIALKIDSLYVQAISGRGAVYDLQGQDDLAQIDYKKTIELDSTNGTAFYNLGALCYDLTKYDEAIIYLNEALRLLKYDHMVFFVRGLSLYEMNEFELAEINFKNAINYNNKTDPWERIDNGVSYYYKGLSNLNLNHLKQACSDFENSIAHNYEDAEIEYNKCNCKKLLSEQFGENIDSVFVSSEAVEVKIYPNPIHTYALISTKNNEKLLNLNLKIVSVEGQTVQSINNISDSFIFNRKDIKSGTYLFIISNKEGIVSTQKIIIE
jgi:tetratricopeptide (TPR) repeat protein